MDDGEARDEIKSILERGLATEVHPRADSPEEVQSILDRLRVVSELPQKLAIAGFTLATIEHHGVEQACEACMYFLVHRRFCDLPELRLAVEPRWSCRLWRI